MFSITNATIEFESHFHHIYNQFGNQGDKAVDSYLAHKLRHVYGVLDATLRVIAQEPSLQTLPREIKRKAEIVALWHDIGRFYQVQEGKIVGNSVYEHGDGAFALLRQTYGHEYMSILLAVKLHNKFSHDMLFDEPDYHALSDEEQKEALLLTKIIRDADKIQNLQFFTFDHFYEVKKFESRVSWVDDDNTFLTGWLTPEAEQQFLNGEIVNYNNVRTFADKLLTRTSWLYDINYTSTKDVIKRSWFIDVVEAEMKERWCNTEVVSHAMKLLW